jgi:DNA replication factor GINS
LMVGFSFEDAKRVWIGEKTSRDITDLHADFYPNVARHVAELNIELKRSEHLRRELLREELRNVLQMVQEIHLLRVLKAMDQMGRGRSPGSSLDGEHRAFDGIKQILDKLYTEQIKPAISGQATIVVPREKTNEALIFLTDIPQIIGDDIKQYGPFKRGEVAFLPKRSAELLIKKGTAQKFEVKAV